MTNNAWSDATPPISIPQFGIGLLTKVAPLEERLTKVVNRVAPGAVRALKRVAEELFQAVGQSGADSVGKTITPSVPHGLPSFPGGGSAPLGLPVNQVKSLADSGVIPSLSGALSARGSVDVAPEPGEVSGYGLYIAIGVRLGFVTAVHVAVRYMAPSEQEYAKRLAANREAQIAAHQEFTELTPEEQAQVRQQYEQGLTQVLAALGRNRLPTNSAAFVALSIARG